MSMSEVTPRVVVESFVAAFNRRDVAALAALYHEDAVNHQVAEAPVVGREAIQAMFEREFARAEMVCVVEQILEDGEWGILEWRDPLGLRGCGFFHVVDGRIYFQRGYWDKLSFLQLHKAPKADRDARHLRRLARLHFLFGVLLIFASLAAMGLSTLIHMEMGMRSDSEPGFGDYVALAIAWSLTVSLFIFAIVSIVSGGALADVREYRRCLITSAFQCLFVPVGTLLGVGTILVLLRPSVQARFEEKALKRAETAE
jgi:limonene-1,2-epoxide hydrolase